MFGQLHSYITTRTNADPAQLAYISQFFTRRRAVRNEFLLTPGVCCRHYYFVDKGCLRLFAVNDDGLEGTRYFAFEGAFGTALPSLIDQQPSFEYLQAVEASELLVIGRDDFFHLVDTVLPFAQVYRQILEAAFITAQKRIYGFQNMNALEKFNWLLQYNPKVLTRLSNKLVASYLGITPSTLSRLKAKL